MGMIRKARCWNALERERREESRAEKKELSWIFFGGAGGGGGVKFTIWKKKQIKQKRPEQSERLEISIKTGKNSKKMVMGDYIKHNSRVKAADDWEGMPQVGQ